MKLTKALILDLDGTVRRSKTGKTFIEDENDIELIPNMEKWIWRYRDNGYLIFGISNQAGVSHGFKSWITVGNEMDTTFALFKRGKPFHAVKWCFHDPKGKVEPFNHRSLGRKPDIGMLYEMEVDAYKEGFIVDWDNSLFVGDRPEDEECAKRAGIPFRHIDNFQNSEGLVEKTTTNLSFEAALVALKSGLKVCRSGWNGKGMYLYLIPPDSYPVVTEIARAEFGDMVPYTAYVAIKTVQGNVSPWQPSNNDMLSEDWEIIH